jgi:hypothetical protein
VITGRTLRIPVVSFLRRHQARRRCAPLSEERSRDVRARRFTSRGVLTSGGRDPVRTVPAHPHYSASGHRPKGKNRRKPKIHEKPENHEKPPFPDEPPVAGTPGIG